MSLFRIPKSACGCQTINAVTSILLCPYHAYGYSVYNSNSCVTKQECCSHAFSLYYSRLQHYHCLLYYVVHKSKMDYDVDMSYYCNRITS